MLLGLEIAIRALCAKFMRDAGAAWLRWGRNSHYVSLGLACFERAAKLDNADAHFELGLFCEGGGHGIGVKGKALDHYQRAAELGHAEAMFRKGEMLRWGIGVAPDPEAGRAAFRQAAEMGWGPAASALSEAYERGDGGPAEAERSGYWRQRAEMLGSMPASRSSLLPRPEEPARDPLVRITDAFADGLDQWLGQAIHHPWFKWFFWLVVIPGGLLAILALIAGVLSFIGFTMFLSAPWVTIAFLSFSLGVPSLLIFFFWMSLRQGMHWSFRGRLQHAKAERGEPVACFQRGMAFLKGGPETPRDEAEARRWLRMAAERGHAESMAQLADLMRYGSGGAKDLNQAKEWLKEASQRGHGGAKQVLEEWAERDARQD